MRYLINQKALELKFKKCVVAPLEVHLVAWDCISHIVTQTSNLPLIPKFQFCDEEAACLTMGIKNEKKKVKSVNSSVINFVYPQNTSFLVIHDTV